MSKGLAHRRSKDSAKKQKYKKIIQVWIGKEPSPKQVGHLYQTHGKPCSCYMCGNPRKFLKKRTRQELRSLLDDTNE